MRKRYKRWLASRDMEKALRHAERLSISAMLETIEQGIFTMGSACDLLRRSTDPETRLLVAAEAKACADLMSVFLDEIADRSETSTTKR